MESLVPYAADVPSIEYKINEFLSLKLERSKTQIYVNDNRFLQCRRLVLNISKKDIPIYDEINSIDEAADLYQKHLYQNIIIESPFTRFLHEEHDITPEQEFWGHCSNLQAWYENDYDTRLLHSNLAFYLLKELVDAGDPIARKVFKNEVAERFESGYQNTIISIFDSKLLDYFTLEEKRELIRSNVAIILKCDPELLDCFSLEEKKELIQENKALIYEKFKGNPSMLYHFLRSCYRRFPSLIEDILLQILTLQNGKDIIFSIIQEDRFFIFQFHFPRLFLKVEENEIRKDILDCIEKIWSLKNERHNAPKIVFGDDLEKLVDCKKCGKYLTLKPLYTLLKKEQVFCPCCGRIITQKFNPRERLVYFKRVLEVSP